MALGLDRDDGGDGVQVVRDVGARARTEVEDPPADPRQERVAVLGGTCPLHALAELAVVLGDLLDRAWVSGG